MNRKFLILLSVFFVFLLIHVFSVDTFSVSADCSGAVCARAGTYIAAVTAPPTLIPTATVTTGPPQGPAPGGPAPTEPTLPAPPGPPPESKVKCDGRDEINTAIGCIPVGDITQLSRFLLSIGVGVGGGIAFILMVYGAFMVMTSSGNPQRLNAGKELLWSAISGLLLLLFSVFILRFLGVEILRIPGWT